MEPGIRTPANGDTLGVLNPRTAHPGRLTDVLAFGPGQRAHELGLGALHELLRSVEALTGSVDIVMQLAPRPEYGLVRPLLRVTPAGARTFGGQTRSR